ncbi:MAG: glyoxalase/bleomycin resistance/extradiol dioxygenase family protein [Deltaproteobacteria bacterium]|jgi:predicted lactoylglutathione lyase|nr:glyoxalase/bleomycin resistance/extradiol dioxygenase family protein [Deltaproteobacteria bacterium]
MTQARKIFVNLAVRDLEATMAFWKQLGLTFNPQFTDKNAACMIISPESFVMLLVEPFFQGFTKKAITTASTHTEVMVALSCESRAEVDEFLAKALAAGGRAAMPNQDHGFMYAASFYDLDDHHWEVVWMDPAAING